MQNQDIFNPFSLSGKTILVTGASSGIGRETAIVCSRMGAKVVITGRNILKLVDTNGMLEGTGHLVITLDLTDPESFNAFVDEVPELDGIVHCAGIGDRTMLKMAREKDIERVMKTNFDGPVLLQRVNCVCPAMVWTELVQHDAELTGADYHKAEKTYPLKRFGKPEDVANLIVYLLSDASSWMTGSCIDITGGGEFTLKA